jgi:nucleoside-diphosphate-sugar epimerase
MARALVIGGTLFIGRALVDQLLARGDDVDTYSWYQQQQRPRPDFSWEDNLLSVR